jgi:orotidine-5'-phosphate decarboxylase
VCCFKPQIAHFAAQRAEDALERVIAHIHQRHPGVPVILDAKRGDIGSTAQFYAAEAFDRYGADAVTVNPYLGRDSVQPFLDRADRGVVVLCRTSNPGARDLQDLIVHGSSGGGTPLYQHVAKTVARDWNGNGNCMLVVGATYPRELAEVRAFVGDMPLLVPGVGAQGGDVAAVVQNGKNSAGQGLVISSSRSILYASSADDFAVQARNAAALMRAQISESLIR